MLKVSGAALATKVMSLQSTSRARATGTSDLRFPTSAASAGQNTDSSQTPSPPIRLLAQPVSPERGGLQGLV